MIHPFLSTIPQELTRNDWKMRSVFYIKESGISMFYTSVVLFAGFSVLCFLIFGNNCTWWLNCHHSRFEMLSNLMLLPCLVLTLNKWLTSEPTIDVLSNLKSRTTMTKENNFFHLNSWLSKTRLTGGFLQYLLIFKFLIFEKSVYFSYTKNNTTIKRKSKL
jgi:hypothetical protein